MYKEFISSKSTGKSFEIAGNISCSEKILMLAPNGVSHNIIWIQDTFYEGNRFRFHDSAKVESKIYLNGVTGTNQY